jgi:ubiquinone/menaquinone biosynthesis C-methylase UbiE
MLNMSPVQDKSVDAVFSSHNIEHLYPHEVPVALHEFHRVLKDDGFLLITCPDLQEVCRLIGEGKLTDSIYQSPAGPIAPLDILYGHRPSMARGNLFMAHKSGFILKVLLGTLRAAGFSSVAGYRRPHPSFDLWAIASRNTMSETDLKALLEAHRPL